MAEPKTWAEVPLVLTITGAAEVLAVHPDTVRKLLASGELRGVQVGQRGDWRITRDALRALVEPPLADAEYFDLYVSRDADLEGLAGQALAEVAQQIRELDPEEPHPQRAAAAVRRVAARAVRADRFMWEVGDIEVREVRKTPEATGGSLETAGG